MSKFITTKKNPIFKKGLKVSETRRSTFNPYHNRKDNEILLSSDDEAEFLKKGWIKEVEKKEFTKSDVVDIVNAWMDDKGCIPFEQYFNMRLEYKAK